VWDRAQGRKLSQQNYEKSCKRVSPKFSVKVGFDPVCSRSDFGGNRCCYLENSKKVIVDIALAEVYAVPCSARLV